MKWKLENIIRAGVGTAFAVVLVSWITGAFGIPFWVTTAAVVGLAYLGWAIAVKRLEWWAVLVQFALIELCILVFCYTSLPYSSIGSAVYTSISKNVITGVLLTIPLIGQLTQLVLALPGQVAIAICIMANAFQLGPWLTSPWPTVSLLLRPFQAGAYGLELALGYMEYPFILDKSGQSIDFFKMIGMLQQGDYGSQLDFLQLLNLLLSVLALEAMVRLFFATFLMVRGATKTRRRRRSTPKLEGAANG